MRPLKKILGYATLVQIADRYSTFVGGNPHTLSATFHLISWVENGLGNHHIRGGLYQIVRAFEEALQEVGVTIFLETPARRIHLRGERSAAVETRNGLIDADAIIVATYHTYAQRSLLGRKTYPTPKQSLSGLVFLWGVEGVSPFGHHNILFSGDYAAIAAGRLDYEPTVYVCISARTDSADAPAGSENWFVLLNVPPVGSAWREEDTMRFRERAIRRIRQVWGGVCAGAGTGGGGDYAGGLGEYALQYGRKPLWHGAGGDTGRFSPASQSRPLCQGPLLCQWYGSPWRWPPPFSQVRSNSCTPRRTRFVIRAHMGKKSS
jgi:phytoene dehydrogenase-like protein